MHFQPNADISINASQYHRYQPLNSFSPESLALRLVLLPDHAQPDYRSLEFGLFFKDRKAL